MIKIIAAIDSKRGLANDQGIPWDLPTDKTYYRKAVRADDVVMGGGTYHEFRKPLSVRQNFVANLEPLRLSAGFSYVQDARQLLQKYTNSDQIIWNIGGAELFQATIDLADELYLTLIDGDFGCTKFFPDYRQDFEQISKDPPITENGITFRFTVWKRKDRGANQTK